MESEYLKKRRDQALGLRAPDPKKEKKPLKRDKPLQKSAGRSDKTKGVMAALGPLYRDFIEKKPECEIASPECTYQATTVHHTAGRGVKKIMDIKTWKSSCDACNHYVEVHDEWARKKGFKASRHSKN